MTVSDLLKGSRFKVEPEELGRDVGQVEFSFGHVVKLRRAVVIGNDVPWDRLVGTVLKKVVVLIGDSRNGRTVVLGDVVVKEYLPAAKLDAARSDVVVEELLCVYESRVVEDKWVEKEAVAGKHPEMTE